MAEGFAHAYGRDVMVAESAGLLPAYSVARDTVRTMAERNVDISTHVPKHFEPTRSEEYDLLINMSGMGLPEEALAPARDWDVPDPIGESEEVYRMVCDQIEGLVMDLIRELRARRDPSAAIEPQ
jgi:protein-tyrosine-phosphatase